MKNNLFAMVFVSLFFVVLGVNATNLTTDDFKITPIDTPSAGLNVSKAWNLKYANTQNVPVTIEMVSTKKGVDYVVYSNYFEVVYSCCKNGFGVRNIKHSMSRINPDMIVNVLDENQMLNQKLIVPQQVSEEKALGLIASYLPDLLKEEFKYLLN